MAADPHRRRRRRDAQPVAGLLRRYQDPSGRTRAAGPPAGMDTLAEAWAAVAGRDADRSLPIRRTRNGVVTVACADAGTAQSVAARADILADALGIATGEPVRGIRAVVADHALPVRPPRRPDPPAPPGADARAVAEGIAASVDDEVLRDLIARAAAFSLQRTWER